MRPFSSLSRRVVASALAVASVGILSTGAAVYYASYRTITAQGTAEVTHLVEATMRMVHQSADQAVVNQLRAAAEQNREIVAFVHRQYLRGTISEQEAKERAAAIIGSQRIGSSGYLYCIDSQGVMRVHPNRALLAKELSSFAFIREQMARKDGYLEYSWRNPGERAERPKALYMTYFQPWDWIISASSYRDEFNGLVRAEDFRSDLLAVHIGDSGDLTILDGKGTFVVHPSMEGMNLANVADARGRLFVREMLARKNGSLEYWWRDSPEVKARRKLAVYRYNPTFDWIVVGSVYADELYRPLRRVGVAVLLAQGVTALLALLLALYLARRIVSSEDAGRLALEASLEATQTVIDKVPFALALIEPDLTIRRANDAAGRILGLCPGELVGRRWLDFFPPDTVTDQAHGLSLATLHECEAVSAQGAPLSVLQSVMPIVIQGKKVLLDAFLDLTERKQLETQLRHAQKLEAVGQLAAGIAHEINTPAQFVGDNLAFLKSAYGDLRALVDEYRDAIGSLPASAQLEASAAMLAADERADLDYLDQNAPMAIDRAIEGVGRIVTIVGAMKDFAHPDSREKNSADLNRALTSTLIVAKNEYKFIADVVTEFGELPLVSCHLGDMSQVFLNLIVNAAHAIAEKVGDSGKKGVIRVRTSRDEETVRIDITDSGTGIPAKIRGRVFDPFFTTKEVGKGTGQGLAIARSKVVDKHGGLLSLETQVGVGTTFTIVLPIDGRTKLSAERSTGRLAAQSA